MAATPLGRPGLAATACTTRGGFGIGNSPGYSSSHDPRLNDNSEQDEPLQMPIESELDLHTFRPQDLGDLIPSYLEACRAKGIYEVRLIHGKGIGNIKRSVVACWL